ncbi:MAG TPA: phytanoyl-CoA dioxygenase family protein [Vicinamibacteria bacterium]|nr:phytanoyl-CoA dioxygenase family protein [Vicinamibacteria bacterium]
MSSSDARRQFADQGFLCLPGLLTEGEVKAYVGHLERLSGRSREWFAQRRRGWLPGGLKDAWTRPDGVSRHREFWPLLFHDRLLEAVHDALGEEACFLQHTDLHVGFSALTWHRDSVHRRFGEGEDWDETAEPYRLLRVGLYLQGAAEAQFALGLVPGSHRVGRIRDVEQRRLDRSARLAGQVRAWLTRRDLAAARAHWVTTGAGDAILFDPRILHAGTRTRGPKYSVFFAYGVPGAHFDRHYTYYRHLRSDLGYSTLAPDLVQRLREAGLFAGQRPPARELKGAWQPPALQQRLARPFRPRA